MSTLDQAVERFKLLKEKLKGITQKQCNFSKDYPKKNETNKNCQLRAPKKQIQDHHDAKKNEKQSKVTHRRGNSDHLDRTPKYGVIDQMDKENTMREINEKKNDGNNAKQKSAMHIRINGIDENGLTQKKGKAKHKRNNSCNIESFKSQSTNIERTSQNWKQNNRMASLNNSRSIDFEKDLEDKEKVLSEINDLLEKKKQILHCIEKKMEDSRLLQKSSAYDYQLMTQTKSRNKLRAPNLFQMQMESRKRGNSKTMRIHWKS